MSIKAIPGLQIFEENELTTEFTEITEKLSMPQVPNDKGLIVSICHWHGVIDKSKSSVPSVPSVVKY
jgi:hypothetical protein